MKLELRWALPLATLLLVACDGHVERSSSADDQATDRASGDAAYSDDESKGYATEADRTRAMEAKAAAVENRYRESMSEAATPEDRVRAYQEFEQGRQELNEMGEDDEPYADPGDAGDDEGDAFGPPPRR